MILIEQVREMAEFLKRRGQTIIQVYPLKARENAHSNQSRRVLLEVLMNGTVVDPYKFTWRQLKEMRERLQQKAEAAGYQFIEIEE